MPLAAGALQPQLLVGEDVLLMLVLVGFAVAGSNVELRFAMGDTAPVYSPVGAPIVLAVAACSVPQAMLVAACGYLLDRATWQRGRRLAIETAGLGAASAGLAGVLVHAAGLSFDSPGAALVAGIGAATVFLAIDAFTYAIWYHVESRAGGQVLRYFVHAAPLDITFTAIAAVLAGPFAGTPPLLALVLAAGQLAMFGISRMATSEARHRAQSDHLRDVFSRYVPETIAERLASGEAEVRLGGELRDVSVLFCDVRGFTTWAETRDAETVVRELNALLGSLAEVVLESFGTLDKFTGDGLMAFWGAPLEQPDHAERACRAAIEMQQLLALRNRELLGGDGARFRIGIGIASGRAVVGNVGHEQRLDYTAIGDTVNLAARLEQSTKELGVATVLSHDTWARLSQPFRDQCIDSGTVCVRGRSAPVRVYGIGYEPTARAAGTWAQPGSSASGLPVEA